MIFHNRMKGKIDVYWHKTKKIHASIKIPDNSYLKSSLSIPFHNRMKGIYSIIEPPRTKIYLKPVHDTFITNDSPFLNFGQENSMIIGNIKNQSYKGLLKFDLENIIPQKNIIVTKCNLILKLSSHTKNFNLTVKEANSQWQEKYVTWLNQPIQGKKIKEVNIKSNEKIVNIDFKDIFNQWIESPQYNYGVFLESSQQLNNYIEVFSKEHLNGEKSPELFIEYIDLNSLYIQETNKMSSCVQIFSKVEKPNTLNASVEWESKIKTCKLDSKINICREGCIYSSIEIVSGNLYGSLEITHGQISSTVDIYANSTQSLSKKYNTLNIEAITMPSYLHYSQQKRFDGNIRYSNCNNIDSTFIINPNKIYGNIHVSDHNQIDSYIEIKNEKLNCSVHYSNQEKLKANLMYGYFNDIKSSIDVRGNNNINNEIRYSHVNNIDCGIEIRGNSNINSTIDKILGSSEMKCYLNSRVNNNILSDLSITHDILPSYLDFKEINSLMSTLIINPNRLHGYLSIRAIKQIQAYLKYKSTNIMKSQLYIISEHIPSYIHIYGYNSSHLNGNIDYRSNSNIKNKLRVSHGNAMNCNLSIYQDGIDIMYCGLTIGNDEYEYNKQRSYGFIM